MAQTARAISDKLNGSNAWFAQSTGLHTNLYAEIDEGYPGNDSTDYDYIGPSGGDNPPMVWRLTSISTPGNGNVSFKLRHYANGTITAHYAIYENYVDESNKGTLLGTTDQAHAGDATWHSDTFNIAITGATDGSQLYCRAYVTNTSASLYAITAFDADFPDVAQNLTLTATSGSFDLTGNAVAFAHTHTLVGASGSFTFTGNAAAFQKAKGFTASAASFVLTGRAVEFSRSVIPFVRSFASVREAIAFAYDLSIDLRWALVDFTVVGTKYLVQWVDSRISGEFSRRRSAHRVMLIANSVLAASGESTGVYAFDTGSLGYTFIAPEQDLSANRPCPAADPVNRVGERTVRVSYYSRELKVIYP